jgi:hypothetical protein
MKFSTKSEYASKISCIKQKLSCSIGTYTLYENVRLNVSYPSPEVADEERNNVYYAR